MDKRTSGLHVLIVAASLVVIIAGIRAAKALVVPFLLAVFFAVIFTPPLRWLQRKRVPTPVALLMVIASIAMIGVSVGLLVGSSLNDINQSIPRYRQAIETRWNRIEDRLVKSGLPLSQITGRKLPGPAPSVAEGNSDVISGAPDSDAQGDLVEDDAGDSIAGWAVWLVRRLLLELAGVLSNAVLILVTLIFMLLEASRLPAKLHAALGQSGSTLHHLETVVTNIRRYMAIKTATSLLTGILVTVFLTLLGIDYPILWGLSAFLLNFVPNIGSILAAIPPVLLALVGPASGSGLETEAAAELGMMAQPEIRALITALGFVAINCFISYAIEPQFMGKGLGLSTLVVFLSLVFWGWVLGPTGMLLSAPLTMSVHITLRNYDQTHWIATLMGSKAPKVTHA